MRTDRPRTRLRMPAALWAGAQGTFDSSERFRAKIEADTPMPDPKADKVKYLAAGSASFAIPTTRKIDLKRGVVRRHRPGGILREARSGPRLSSAWHYHAQLALFDS